jgi:hypothetical protein
MAGWLDPGLVRWGHAGPAARGSYGHRQGNSRAVSVRVSPPNGRRGPAAWPRRQGVAGGDRVSDLCHHRAAWPADLSAEVGCATCAGLGGGHGLSCCRRVRSQPACADDRSARTRARRLSAARLDAHREQVLLPGRPTRAVRQQPGRAGPAHGEAAAEISGCSRTPAGAEAFLAIRSYISTAASTA